MPTQPDRQSRVEGLSQGPVLLARSQHQSSKQEGGALAQEA